MDGGVVSITTMVAVQLVVAPLMLVALTGSTLVPSGAVVLTIVVQFPSLTSWTAKVRESSADGSEAAQLTMMVRGQSRNCGLDAVGQG